MVGWLSQRFGKKTICELEEEEEEDEWIFLGKTTNYEDEAFTPDPLRSDPNYTNLVWILAQLWQELW